MSKILQKNETGYGILIEHDAGYMTPNQNENLLTEGLSLKNNEPVLVNCILQKYGVKNKNGRVYPKEVLVPQVQEYQELVDTNSAVSEADHPDSSTVSLQNISHIIRKMWWGEGENEHILYGQLEIITSPAYRKDGTVSMIGDKIVEYLKRGIRLGISSRGVGSLEEDVDGENVVQSDFELICFDLVATPSTPGAFLFPEKNQINVTEETKNKKYKINEHNNKIIKALDVFLL